MTDAEQKLDSSLVWDHEHLSDLALQALADGELGLLPEQAVKHVTACPRCDQYLAAVALQALEVATALAARPPVSEAVPVAVPARARRAFPLPAFAGALAIAVAGLVIQIRGAGGCASCWSSLIAQASRVLMHGLRLAFGGVSSSPTLAAAPLVAAALLVLAGVLIARRAPVHLNLKGPA